MRGWGDWLGDDDRDDECLDRREVVVRYRAEMFGFARSLTRNDADAEDLAQSAALRALESGEPLRDPRRAKAYLFTILRNLATDQARRRARIVMEPRAVLPETPSADASVDELLVRADDWAEPRAAMAELPEPHREILYLRFAEELDNAAIARRLHITEHAARQRVYRAMQALRAIARARRLAS
jgi:RNA polymerase sigma-70 factor, ECF subfamily